MEDVNILHEDCWYCNMCRHNFPLFRCQTWRRSYLRITEYYRHPGFFCNNPRLGSSIQRVAETTSSQRVVVRGRANSSLRSRQNHRAPFSYQRFVLVGNQVFRDVSVRSSISGVFTSLHGLILFVRLSFYSVWQWRSVTEVLSNSNQPVA